MHRFSEVEEELGCIKLWLWKTLSGLTPRAGREGVLILMSLIDNDAKHAVWNMEGFLREDPQRDFSKEMSFGHLGGGFSSNTKIVDFSLLVSAVYIIFYACTLLQ